MVFQCSKCNETFESDGLQVIAHGQSIGYVCPSCVAGAKTVMLILEQKMPGQFELKVVEVQGKPT
jgi:Holliday junction resolvase